MAKQTIGIGTEANDGTGDQVRVAFDKVNDNFNEVYGNDFTTYDRLGVEFTTVEAATSDTFNFDNAQIFTRTLSGTPALVFQNAKPGMVKDLVLSGDVTISWPTGTKFVSGTYSVSATNFIQVVVIADGNYWVSISQEQV